MMQRALFLGAVLLTLTGGCDCSRRQAPPKEPESRAIVVAPASASQPTPQTAREQLAKHGLTLEPLPGGMVALKGADRWGTRLDATYESAEYLRKALPVLERSVTSEQATLLRRVLAEQAGSAPAAGPAPAQP